jgi:hypothetical protein
VALWPASCAARAAKCRYPIFPMGIGTMRFSGTRAGSRDNVTVVQTTVVVVVVVVVVGVGHCVYGGGGGVFGEL